ncbi:unnamed protein product [Effrenium voratum]|nr:unnamed protein product [Effrenium voratum]
MVCFLQALSALFALSAALRPTETILSDETEEVRGDHLCCCHQWIPPAEVCVKDSQAFAKVDFVDGVLRRPAWFNASIVVQESFEYEGAMVHEDADTRYFRLHYLGEMQAAAMGIGPLKLADSWYEEYTHHEKQGRNARGADDFKVCTRRTYECECEWLENPERKDCKRNPVEHCDRSSFRCDEWADFNKCTLSSEKTMKLMHKTSGQRIGTCFAKKDLPTRYLMAQCPEGYEKCDCNNQC